jgi:UDP-glucose 4-epimerase
MRVLVTGGAGFIGSHIVDACRGAGHELFVIDDLSSGSRQNLPSDVPLHVIDIRDTAAVNRVFDEVRPQAVSHQAAQMSVSRSVREPVFDAEVNVLGLLNVFDAAARVGTQRIVFASSGGVLYGDVYEPAPESTPANPISPYGISKWVGEKYLQFYARERGLKGVALRYANVYGPRQNPHGEAGVMAIFSQKHLAGEVPTINGDGKFDRDYVFGPDVAKANLLALTADFAEPFLAVNIGTGLRHDVNALASLVRGEAAKAWAKWGKPGEPPAAIYGPTRAGDLRSSIVDAKLAQQTIGWTPHVSFAEGVRQTVAWFAERVSR